MNAFHLALDPLFIYAAGWGVSGAAAATVVAEVGAAAAYGVCIWQRRDVLGVRPAWRNYGPPRRCCLASSHWSHMSPEHCL